MRKNVSILLALFLILPGLLFTVSCAKKTVQTGTTSPSYSSGSGMASSSSATDAEREAKERALAEAQLKEAQAKEAAMKAKEMFQNEYLYFEFDSSALTSAAQAILKKKALWIKANPFADIIIEGHCDERGTNEYNLALGDRRANSAKTFLIDLGISPAKLTTISYGEERPLDMGHNEEAWAKNRRAQFVVE